MNSWYDPGGSCVALNRNNRSGVNVRTGVAAEVEIRRGYCAHHLNGCGYAEGRCCSGEASSDRSRDRIGVASGRRECASRDPPVNGVGLGTSIACS